jgi:carbon monoxide dehydrogenase subunit G
VRIEESVEIAKPVEFVWALIRDLERAPEWQETLESVDVAGGKEVRSFGGRRHESSFVVVEDDPPRSLVISSEGGPASVRAAFELHQSGDGTRLDFTLDVELSGVARFAAGMIKGSAERGARDDLERFKKLAES